MQAETCMPIRTLRMDEPTVPAVWLRSRLVFNWQTGAWDIMVQPETPTIDIVFNDNLPTNHEKIYRKLLEAKFISKSERVDNTYVFTVWSRRPAKFALTHAEPEGIMIDGESINY